MFDLKAGDLVAPVAGIHGEWSLLVHPEERKSRSKTGEWDMSIILDSSWMPWVGPVLKALSQLSPDESIWDFSYHDLLKMFHKCGKEIGVPHLTPTSAGTAGHRGTGVRTCEA